MANIGLFLGAYILMIVEFFMWSRFYNCKFDYKNYFLHISLICLAILSSINYSFVSVYVRIIIITACLLFFNWLSFRRKINEILISTLYGQFLLVFSDTIGISIFAFIKGGLDFVKNNYFGTFIGNVFVAFILLFIGNLKFVKKIYGKLVSITNNIHISNLLSVSLLVIISINILMALAFYKLNSFYVIIINLILLSIYSFIIYKTINEKNKNILIQAENDSLMESLHQYEDMVDRQRVDNHENKNQLLIIKSMIDKKDKNVVKYIDTIVKDKKEDDEVLYSRVKTIPSGGLQGIIYQKMLIMKDEKIVFSLDVSRDVRKINLDSLSMEDNYKLCKIIGVFLDNAIEASKEVSNKCIMISLYVDEDDLVIDISNRFSGEIDLSMIDGEGYTTKGEGHGYGLSLVKKILSQTDLFVNEKSIKKDVFKQVIKVKIKNT